MKRAVSILALVGFLLPALQAWQPGTSQPQAAGGFVVDVADRTDVLAFFHTAYTASEGATGRMNWTGNLTLGNAGTTSAAFREDVRRRVNFFRAMAGLPADVAFDNEKAAKCQQAALMFAANGELNHNPPLSWLFYSAAGAEAAGSSNIHLGRFGPEAIDDYMEDPGDNNAPVGHRRWILYPESVEMATGDVPSTPGKWSANSLWVVGNFGPSQPLRFVSWPNAGFIPRRLVPPRWSLSRRDANFASAVVTMKQGSSVVPVTVISRTDNGFGDNTIVWEPQTLITNSDADIPYEVTVSGITGNGVPGSHTYTVRVFNPDVLGHATTISGPSAMALSGADFSFASVPQADAYELRVSRLQESTWTEGAEASVGIKDGTSNSYSLRQSTVKRNGNSAFQLTIPGFSEPVQWFEIDRELVPSAQSKLVFHDLFRWVHAKSQLSVEVSTDGGMTWREVWKRNGKITTNEATDDDWETVFQRREVDLAGLANQPVRLRFVLRAGDFAFPGTSIFYGAFVDDISITNAVDLIQTKSTQLSAAAKTFRLDAGTAGSGWAPGAKFAMRVRPQVGTRWFEGPIQIWPVVDFWFGQGQGVALTLPTDVLKISGLPTGLKFNALTRTLSGRPTKAGSFTAVATVPGGVRNYSFLVEPAPAWSVGTFEAIVAPPEPAGAGPLSLGAHLTVTTTSMGAFSGTLRAGAKKVAFKGQFEPIAESLRGDAPISANVSVALDPRNPSSQMEIVLCMLPDSDPDDPGLSGSVEFAGLTFDVVAGWQRVWNARTNPAFGATPRTLNVAFENPGNAGPAGVGFAVAKVPTTGLVAWAGTLSDGTAFTASHGLTPSRELPLYASPGASPRAVVFGIVGTTSGSLVRIDPDGDFRWIKLATPAGVVDRVHRDGFDVDLEAVGAQYVAPALGSGLFGNLAAGSSLVFDFGGSSMASVPALTDYFADGRARIPVSWRVPPGFTVAVSGFVPKITFAPSTGSFVATAAVSGPVSRALNVRGLYIPDLDAPSMSRVVGFHLLPDLPGVGQSASITPVQSGPFAVEAP
ncbi:MAG: CAP domain-containing protein [Terrimicrobiaceae bacterium]|nr:CAP domain-containing protein [Terrimicrobiaceae bacterium]